MTQPLFELPDKPYRAFIFDCDGTLADSMPQHRKAWLRALRAHGARFEFSWATFMSRAGMTVEQTVHELNQEFGFDMDPALVARDQRLFYEELMLDLKPIPEVVDFARRKLGAAPLSVASGGDRSIVERTLHLIGVTDLFPTVIVAADVARGKPEPDMFLLAAERMRVAPEDCLVFEDSLLGISAAERAGMGAVLVRSRAPITEPEF